jgi:diketogulonate reductase-like aldo/keto reductase
MAEASPALSQSFPLPNAPGVSIPVLGLGTWRSKPPAVVTQPVIDALKAGYRHIDCAEIYENEAGVGNGIAASGVPREQIFLTSKVWNTNHHAADVRKALQNTLTNLKTTYLDLYLIHWPVAQTWAGDTPTTDASVTLEETWAALEALQREGLVRAIGLSNCNRLHVERILKVCKIKPAALQIELHPYLQQRGYRLWLQQHGIQLMGYCPLSNPALPRKEGSPGILLEDPVVLQIAAKHKRTPAQVCLRWAIQSGIATIPKSVTASRIVENSKLFNWSLAPVDMEELARLDKGQRCVRPTWFDFKEDDKLLV